MLAWQVRNRRVLVIGAGPVAASRISHALNADAAVTVIAPHDDKICDEVAGRIAAGQVTHIPRAFEEGDIANDSDRQIAMVLAAVDDPEVSQRIARVCRAHRVPVNVADVPPLCDFYFAAIHRDGPVQVAVSTGGKGPRLAARVRGEIAKLLSGPSGEEREHGKKMGTVGEAVERAGRLREKLREIVPGMSEADSKARMRWFVLSGSTRLFG